MSRFRLLLRTARYFRNTNLAVLLAVAVGTAVLTGSLLVGESVRYSLLQIVERRLGKVDHLLTTPGLFDDALAGRIERQTGFKERFTGAEALLYTKGSCEGTQGAAAHRVNVFGRTSVTSGACVLSRALAQQLEAVAGSTLVLRMAPVGRAAADLPVGFERTDISLMRLRVEAVAEEGGFEDAFSFYGTQRPARNIWVSPAELRDVLDEPAASNVLLISARPDWKGVEAISPLQDLLKAAVSLRDCGLRIKRVGNAGLSLESEQILFPKPMEDALEKAFPETLKAFVYVANTLRNERTRRECPYSTIAGLSSLPDGTIPPNGIVLNAWTARDLDCKPGDTIEIRFFKRTGAGLLEEKTAALRLERVIGMSGIGADRTLVPDFPGVTDTATMASWKPPHDFEFHAERVRDKDEAYWNDHGAAPKAFVDIRTAQRLWGTEFGSLTSIRFPDMPEAELERMVLAALNPKAAGLVFRPIRHEQMAGASGNTDFGQLFVGFSFFLVVSSALLVLLVLHLSVEQRARQVGVLKALGFTAGGVRSLFLTEGLALVVLGAAIGALLSAGFARLMIEGLKTIWNTAVGTSRLVLFVDWWTLLLGGLVGAAVGALSVHRGLARLGRLEVADSLARGRRVAESRVAGWRGYAGVCVVLFVCALVVAAIALLSDALSTTAAFFAAGAALLVSLLLALRAWLGWRSSRRGSVPGMSVPALGIRNAWRNPVRSILTAALLASASFVVVSVSTMRDRAVNDKAATGGFQLVAEFDAPVPYDLNTRNGRQLLGLDGNLWERVHFVGMRLSDGQDASCRNLYRPSNPRVASVPEALKHQSAFALASVLKETENPWTLLDADNEGDPVPAFADYETARWILHAKMGDTVNVRDERGTNRRLRLIGLLKPGIFQGELLLSETSFRKLFPSAGGFRRFLIAAAPDDVPRVAEGIRHRLGDFGATVETTPALVRSFMVVADTHISAFLALGSLGLLLGSLGVFAVLMRTLMERRSETALLRALGFGWLRAGIVSAAENAFLLIYGLAAGTAAALFAVAPEFFRGAGRLRSALSSLALVGSVIAVVMLLMLTASAPMLRRLGPAMLRRE